MTALPVSRRALLVEGCVVFISLLGVLLWASPGLGLTWDESIYFHFSDSLRSWSLHGFPLDQASLTKFWAFSPYHNPHPPLLKICSAATAWFFADILPFPLDYRSAHLIFAATGLATAFILLRRIFSRALCLSALIFAAAAPRVFGEILIATTDGPVWIAWLVLTLLAWRWCETASTPRWLWPLFAIVLSCAVGVKFTGWLAVFPLLAYALWKRKMHVVSGMIAAAAAALIVLTAVHPEYWRSPGRAIWNFLTYPGQRREIPISLYYLGRMYVGPPPWHYFDLMTLATWPMGLWLFLPFCLRRDGPPRRLAVILFFSAGFWFLLGHVPSVPKHDGVRQFVSVYPLMGLLSWLGFVNLFERIHWERFMRDRLKKFVWALPGLAMVLTLWSAHPHELSYYSGLVGGIRGAEKKGFEMTYYFEAINRDFLQAMNREVTKESTLKMVPSWPDVIGYYQKVGQLTPHLRFLGEDIPQEPDYYVFSRRRGILSEDLYLFAPAVYEATYQGVSLAKFVRVKDP